MTAMKARSGPLLGEHVRVTVWAGPDEEHLANLGVLVCREDEAAALVERINLNLNPAVSVLQQIATSDRVPMNVAADADQVLVEVFGINTDDPA